MPDRVAIFLTFWLLLWTGIGTAIGKFVFGAPGTGLVDGFLFAVMATFLWPWIVPGPIDRWMDGYTQPQETPDGWIESGRKLWPEVRRWSGHHRDRMDDGAAA